MNATLAASARNYPAVAAALAVGRTAHDVLVAIHCMLDDGGVNEAGALIRIAHGIELSDDQQAWLTDLDSMYRAGLGSL